MMRPAPAIVWIGTVLLLVPAAGCDDMTRQNKQNPYASRETAPADIPSGVVQYGQPGDTSRPIPPVTIALLERGHTEYHVFCAPCHAETGNGRGMIVQRGFPAPPPLATADLMSAPPQRLYDVVTGGWGVMYGFAQRIAPDDRWAVVAYVRALQRSQHMMLADLTPEQRAAP
ncbi:c-type cytochrome [Gluconacetobacter tumulisoli]|uniref:Cytochrome c n=1 Tax=Gluconacetobacter tumulisoli TaxID=1286189 RepID=A0A7W4K5M3_9PROT|nr:cytochrome c [Gluconacetobacter tumulisoli]MBB2200864.1 cytochrome c [Gluconacetobacter tumulisoli]